VLWDCGKLSEDLPAGGCERGRVLNDATSVRLYGAVDSSRDATLYGGDATPNIPASRRNKPVRSNTQGRAPKTGGPELQ
jgi:hypothetical protein